MKHVADIPATGKQLLFIIMVALVAIFDATVYTVTGNPIDAAGSWLVATAKPDDEKPQGTRIAAVDPYNVCQAPAGATIH